MAAQTGKFVPDQRLYPRDNSGGTMGPKGCSDFGDAGMSKGGESMNDRGGAEDEFKSSRSSSRRGGY